MKICKYEMHGGLCKKTGTYCNCWACLYEEPIEVTEVVRCKDCRYWNNGDCYRLELSRPDDFCSYGERKEELKSTHRKNLTR